jgi:hypothetical protein
VTDRRRPFRVFFTRSVVVAASAALLASCAGRDRPKSDLAASRVTTIGVNSYLWRAALETLSFMPLVQTDSNGGVIVTDWYANPNNPSERVKVTVSILDQDLRADASRRAARSRRQGPGSRPRSRPRPCRSSRTSS